MFGKPNFFHHLIQDIFRLDSVNSAVYRNYWRISTHVGDVYEDCHWDCHMN